MAYLASDRKNAVQLYKHGLSYKAIAQQLGFPNVKAASRVVNRFRNRKTFNDATRRKGRSKLNSNQRNRLKRVILRNPQASLREKRDMFNARPRNIEEGITVSTSTVSRFTQ
jgi:transposase